MPNPVLVTHGAGHGLGLLTVPSMDIRQTSLIMFLLSDHHTSTYYFITKLTSKLIKYAIEEGFTEGCQSYNR